MTPTNAIAVRRSIATRALGIAALIATSALTMAPAHAALANDHDTSTATATAVDRGAKTWREIQGQIMLDKVKAADWDWVEARLKHPKRDLPEVKKMRKDKPLEMAGKCYKGDPPETTGVCYVKNTWGFGIAKDGNTYTYYGFAILD